MIELLAQATQPSAVEGYNEIIRGFYSDAFSSNLTILVCFTGLLVAVSAVGLPWYLEHRRDEKFKEIVRSIEKERDRALAQVNHHSSIHWYEMARVHFMKDRGGPWTQGLRHWCYGIDGAIAAGWGSCDPKWVWFLECLGGFEDSGKGARDIGQLPENRPAVLNTYARLRGHPLAEKYPYRELTDKLSKFLGEVSEETS